MIVVGLLVLLAAGDMGIAGITAYNGGTRSPPFRLDVLGHHLSGLGSRLFFFGLLLGAAAMLGLSMMVAGLGRGARRQLGLPAAADGLPPAGKRSAGAKRPAHPTATRLTAG